ncbi:MAG: hypothetical protein V3T83_09105 [Acidobacteriota bacterium]
MRFLKPLWISSLVFFLLAPGLFAQQQRPDRSSQSRNISRPSVNRSTARSVTSVSRSTARPTTGTARVSGSTSRGSGNSTTAHHDPYYNHCARTVNEIWAYNPYYRSWYGWRDRARFYSLLSRLSWDYRLFGFQLNSSLRRFSFGDTPLTSDVLKLLLRGSTRASNALLADTKALKGLMAGFESGEISKAAFEERSLGLLNQIRSSAKLIRQDFYLEYVDSDNDVKPKSYRPVSDWDEMRALVAELEGMALQVQSRLESIGSDEDVRRMSIHTLRQPSVESLSKGIGRLAKSLKKSSKRLLS